MSLVECVAYVGYTGTVLTQDVLARPQKNGRLDDRLMHHAHVVVTDGQWVRLETALARATTKHQIRVAAQELTGSPAKVVPFISYVLSQCESPTSGVPTTP